MTHTRIETAIEEMNLAADRRLYCNTSPAELIEHAVRQGEGSLLANGALAVRTGKFTGRSPRDKYFVDEPGTSGNIHWGPVNQKLSEHSFDRLLEAVRTHMAKRDLFQATLAAGADERYRVGVRVVSEYAWHSLFARQLLVRPDGMTASRVCSTDEALAPDESEPAASRPFTVLVAPGCFARPGDHGTRSETFIVIHMSRRIVLIGGTEYAGEIKKCVFTVANYLLPLQGVLSMHCSANVSRASGETSLFFGLSGTGKTTLSASADRDLIGDDEHGWSDDGVFNIEGGCYAKCIRLSHEKEPEIFDAIRFGAVLENVVFDTTTRQPDYDSALYTENSRAAYPLDHVPNACKPSVGGHPSHIVFLTADAFGVLPPISRLTPEQAGYHFLSGYTAKIAGTERGLSSHPEATFSACFGLPFLPLSPTIYAGLLAERIRRHESRVWLVNTGWTGGGYGVGHRIDLNFTRTMVEAALSGQLRKVEFAPEPWFGLHVPVSVPGIPSELLNAQACWEDGTAYAHQARMLVRRFHENFERYRDQVDEAVAAAGPSLD